MWASIAHAAAAAYLIGPVQEIESDRKQRIGASVTACDIARCAKGQRTDVCSREELRAVPRTLRRRMTSRSGTSKRRGSVARAMKLLISHVRFACESATSR